MGYYSEWAEQRRNLALNPSAEVNANSWVFSGNSGGAAYSSAWSRSGERSYRVIAGSSSKSGDYRTNTGAGSIPFGMEKGETYTVTAYVNYSGAHSALDNTATSRQRRILIYTSVDGVRFVENFGPQAPNTPGVHRLSHTFTVPANATGIIVGVGCGGSPADNGALDQYIDDILIEETSTLGPYFDGSTNPGGELERTRWLGPVNASPSVVETRRILAEAEPPRTLRARVRLAEPGGTPGRVLPTLSVSASLQAYQAASLTITTTETLPDEFVLILEVSSGDGWHSPRNGLFLMQKSNSDGRDLTGVRTFTGVPWFSALAKRAPVFVAPAVPGENKTDRTFLNPGAALHALVTEAKSRGWGPHVGVAFDGNYDSNGEPWVRDVDGPVLVRGWSMLSEILDGITSAGQGRWWTEGTTLKVVRNLAGEDKTGSVKLRSGDSRPLQTDATDIATDVLVVYASAGEAYGAQRKSVEVTNPGADTRFGRRWAVLTLADTYMESAAVRAAQAYLADLRAPLRQVGFRYEGAVDFLPFRDFQVGDTVLARLDSSWEPRTVQGVTIVSGETTTVEIAVGDRIVPADVKRAQTVGKLTLGSIVGGSAAMPSIPPASNVPAEPVNVRVVSNVGRWEGNAPVGSVTLAWDAVTTGADAIPIVVSGYEVWVSDDSRPWVRFVSTEQPSAVLEWPFGETRKVRVVAVSGAGERSAPSEPVTVTPNAPAQDTTVLGAPVITPGAGVLLVNAPAGAAPAGFQYVTVQWRFAGDAEWLSLSGQGDLTGQVGIIKAPAGSLVEVRLLWRDTAGRTSAPSPVSQGAPGSVLTDIPAGTVTSDKLAASEIWASQAWLDTLRAGVIETPMLSPGVGSQLDISANASVQIAVGRLDDVDAQLGEFSQVVRFEPDGTVWTSPASPISLKLSNEGVAIRNEGRVLTRWTESEMQVQQLRSEQTFIGSTVLTARPGGVTWAHV